MKKTIILTIACMCLAVGAYAQRGSGRLSLGAGLLYKNGLDVTLAYEHEMNYRHAWEFFANGYLQWQSANPANMYARNLSGGTTAPTASAWLTNPASRGDATITEASESGLRAEATRRSSLQDCISATSTTMCCGRAGRYTGKSRET